jgi:hypothetical protein
MGQLHVQYNRVDNAWKLPYIKNRTDALAQFWPTPQQIHLESGSRCRTDQEPRNGHPKTKPVGGVQTRRAKDQMESFWLYPPGDAGIKQVTPAI